MAIKNFLFIRTALKALILITAVELALVSCQSTPTNTSGNPAVPPHGPVAHAPAVPGLPPALPEAAGTPPRPPEPPPQEIKKVAVILGPGGAKAFAHIGVLKAFQKQRIPIGKIVGLEWGALIAGLYASKGQVNDVEWKLYKMEQKGLPRAKGFFSKSLGEDSIKNMDDFLLDAFAKEDVAGARVPFACPSRSIWTGVVAWQAQGLLMDNVRRCLPFPPLFKAQGTFLAGASQALEAIDLLRREGYNVIILVNVLGSAQPVGQESLLENLNYVILWQEVKRALSEASRYNVELVNVDTSVYPMVQFESKKELINLGESAGNSAATMLINKYGF